MVQWSVNVDGVGSVVATAGNTAQAMSGQLELIVAALESAAQSSGSPIVGAALAGYLAQRASDFGYVGQRTGDLVRGLISAAGAYVEADAVMSANASAAAACQGF